MKRLLMLMFSTFTLVALILVIVGCVTTDEEDGSGLLSLDEAIEQSARDIAQELPQDTVVAVLGFSSEQQNLSIYIMDELSGALVDAGLSIADRRNLDFVQKELKFQMTGEVSDETAVSIGKFVGARYVITGQLVKAGDVYRYRLVGINVETAVQESSTRLDVRDDRRFRSLLAGVYSPSVSTALAPGGQEEYTLYFSGDLRGTATIQRDRAGKITVASVLTGVKSYHLNSEICPLIPTWAAHSFTMFYIGGRGSETIVIEGNTTTQTDSDGRMWKRVVDGNTTIETFSYGSYSTWSKAVVDGNTTIETYPDGGWGKTVVVGNTTTITDSRGNWWKTVIEGNTTTQTDSDGNWWKTVIEGNTTTNTFSGGSWAKFVVDGNTTTMTRSDGSWSKTVVDKQGYDIFITIEEGV
jgi:TolB-like protein